MEERNAYKILVGKLERKRPLGRSRRSQPWYSCVADSNSLFQKQWECGI